MLDLRTRSQSDVTSTEKRGAFGDLRLSRFLQSDEEESQCGWCVVLSFVSLCLSVSLSFSWSSGLRIVVCLLLIFPRCREISFLYRFSFLIRSNWVFFVFYREGHGLAEKLLLIIFICCQILSTFRYALILCAETSFSHFEESLISAPITSAECSRGR